MISHHSAAQTHPRLRRCALPVLCGTVILGACVASGALSENAPTSTAASAASAAPNAPDPGAQSEPTVPAILVRANEPSAVAPLGAAPNGDPILARGTALYVKYCAICHGDKGDGGGQFAYLMNPRPRDFTKGNFKLSTTENLVPSDEDLVRTISNGMPGSAMPPWGHLPTSDIDALVAFVRSVHVDATRAKFDRWIADGTIEADEAIPLLAERTDAGAPLFVPPEAPFDQIHWFRGRRLYLENCASCHGVNGEPVAEEIKFDEEGYPVPPRSFVQGIFKGGAQGHQLYARIWKGMKGTPMPASEGVYSGDETWDVIHYVQSLMRKGAQERAQLRQGTFAAPRVAGALPSGPLDESWEQARPLYVGLTPLWWEDERVEGMVVQALHNGDELAIRLTWIDPTKDDHAIRQNEFRDAVAIQFSLTSDPPFYMGSAGDGGGVNIWMWKADRQTNIADGYQDVDSAFPARVVDRYPEQDYQFVDMTVTERPRESITKHDPEFVTAWGAGNLVADPNLQTPVECLVARGPGTLAGKPANVQIVKGQAVYERGLWYVQLQRTMALPHDSEHDDASDERAFKSGDYLPVSFAIWNGSTGDRDGKKNISIWQKLVIE